MAFQSRSPNDCNVETGRQRLEGAELVYKGPDVRNKIYKERGGSQKPNTLYAVNHNKSIKKLDKTQITTLVPKDSILYTVIIESMRSTVIKRESFEPDTSQSVVFNYVQPMYQLGRFLPGKSVVHAFFHFNKYEQQFKMGIFDASEIGGHNLRELPPVTRFENVWNALKQSTEIMQVPNQDCTLAYAHWAGNELACFRARDDFNHVFEVERMLRLPAKIGPLYCASLMNLKDLEEC